MPSVIQKTRRLWLFSLSAASAAAISTAATPPDELFDAESIRCSMNAGYSTMWPKADPITGPARMDLEVTYDNVDARSGTARVITKDGAGDVRVVRSPIGLTFIEIAPAVIDVATIYAKVVRNSSFIVVETRHSALGDQANAQQYYGRCSILQLRP